MAWQPHERAGEVARLMAPRDRPGRPGERVRALVAWQTTSAPARPPATRSLLNLLVELAP